jgi:hypothetical protein
MSKRNSRAGKAVRRRERARCEAGEPGCPGVDDETSHLCAIARCGRSWTCEMTAEDGWSIFVCDAHYEAYDVDAPDPVHGRIVSVTGVWDMPEVQAVVSRIPPGEREAFKAWASKTGRR